MSLLLIGSDLVDTSDVCGVAPRASGSSTLSTVYLADGQFVLGALAPAAQKAAIDATNPAGPLLTTAINAEGFPSPVYVAGQAVQRVTPFTRNGVQGTSWAVRGFATLSVPAQNLAAAQALINATFPPGGGGGGSVVPWAPVPTSPDASALSISFASATRIGNVVTVAVGVLGTSTLSSTVVVTVPLPLPAASPVAGCANGDPGGGVWGALHLATPGGANANFVFDGLAATPFGVLGIMQYTTP